MASLFQTMLPIHIDLEISSVYSQPSQIWYWHLYKWELGKLNNPGLSTPASIYCPIRKWIHPGKKKLASASGRFLVHSRPWWSVRWFTGMLLVIAVTNEDDETRGVSLALW